VTDNRKSSSFLNFFSKRHSVINKFFETIFPCLNDKLSPYSSLTTFILSDSDSTSEVKIIQLVIGFFKACKGI